MSLELALVQGLLPYLSSYARLQARLVSHSWETAFSEHVASASLPAAFWAQSQPQQQADLRLLVSAFPQLQVLQLLLNWHHAPGYTVPQQRSDVYISQLSDDDSDNPDAALQCKQQQDEGAAAKASSSGASKRRRKPTAAAAAAAEADAQTSTGHPTAAAPAAAAASGGASGKSQRKRKEAPSKEAQATAVWLPPWREGKRQRRPKALPGSKPSAAAAAGGPAASVSHKGLPLATEVTTDVQKQAPPAAAAGTQEGGGVQQQGTAAQQDAGREVANLHHATAASPSHDAARPSQLQGVYPKGPGAAAEAATGDAAVCMPPPAGSTLTQDHLPQVVEPVPAAGGIDDHSGQLQSQAQPPAAEKPSVVAPGPSTVGSSMAVTHRAPPAASADASAVPAGDDTAPFAELLRLPQLSHLVLKGPLPPVSWPLVLSTLQAASAVRTLHLQQVYLPPPEALQQLLEGWPQLRVLHLVVSLRSPRLQAAHIEALSEASQLQELRLQVGFTDGGSGAQLDPLLALTGLTSLRVAFTGIMPDQRLGLRHATALSALSHLRELASHGTARALLPQPGMTACTSLTITGQRQRLAVPAMQLLSGCTQLQRLVLTAKKRLPSVAAVHLPQLACLTGLTALAFGLTTGTLRAADTGQMLLLLTSMRGLQQLSLAADHRLRLPEQTVAQLAGSWQRLTHLSLVNCDTVDGLACFRGFRRLRVLNLSPGSSAESGGDQLAGLTAALEGLPQLSDLRLNSRSLKLRHVQEVVEACAPLNQLTSLSLQLNTNTSAAGTLQALARLRCLKRLHLHRVWAAFLAKAATQAALAELQQLWELGLFVDDTTWVSELDALTRQFAFLQQLEGLHQLTLWLGQAFVSRAPREAKVAALLQQLVPLGCRLEWVPEPPDPAAFQA